MIDDVQVRQGIKNDLPYYELPRTLISYEGCSRCCNPGARTLELTVSLMLEKSAMRSIQIFKFTHFYLEHFTKCLKQLTKILNRSTRKTNNK